MKVLITGIAGMIGYHSALKLKNEGFDVVGFDNFNLYYDVNLKYARRKILEDNGITVYTADLLDFNNKFHFLDNEDMFDGVEAVIHLAAYAGVRHSVTNPDLYIKHNIEGTQRLIDFLEKKEIDKVLFASTSCVMHGQPLPWNETDRPSHQTSPYGWSKWVNESQFLGSTILSAIGLRFFTAYGPYGRPDMALFQFTENILKGEPITLFNYGDMARDFTYVEDVANAVVHVLKLTESKLAGPGRILYNVGYGRKVKLEDFVKQIEKSTGKEAKIELGPRQPGDVEETWANNSKLVETGWEPKTPIEEGVEKFVRWYREYYEI